MLKSVNLIKVHKQGGHIMKKLFTTIAVTVALGLTACGSGNEGGAETPTVETASIGMLTDTGGINDRSFNQGTWAGIQRFETDHGTITSNHLSPDTMAVADLVTTAESLIVSGHELIIMPGFVFEEAISILQEKHPETKFIILDGEPENHIEENTLAIYFAEEQAGFMAGVAAALESETSKVGFIGGAEIPPVERFGWGFVAGVAYANETFDLDVEVVDFVYQGSFNDVQAGTALAGGMYDKGIDVIFVAAGAVGTGVVDEAKTRATAEERVFVIGVDSDQFEDGMMANGESVILTSAVKRVDNAAYEYIQKFLDGEFKGGEVVVEDATTNAVGLPDENPNLSDETQLKTNQVFEEIKAGDIVVPNNADDLREFLEEVEFDFTNISF